MSPSGFFRWKPIYYYFNLISGLLRWLTYIFNLVVWLHLEVCPLSFKVSSLTEYRILKYSLMTTRDTRRILCCASLNDMKISGDMRTRSFAELIPQASPSHSPLSFISTPSKYHASSAGLGFPQVLPQHVSLI